jgi:hypothetical protein
LPAVAGSSLTDMGRRRHFEGKELTMRIQEIICDASIDDTLAEMIHDAGCYILNRCDDNSVPIPESVAAFANASASERMDAIIGIVLGRGSSFDDAQENLCRQAAARLESFGVKMTDLKER